MKCERCKQGEVVERVGFYIGKKEPIAYLSLCSECLAGIKKDYKLYQGGKK